METASAIFLLTYGLYIVNAGLNAEAGYNNISPEPFCWCPYVSQMDDYNPFIVPVHSAFLWEDGPIMQYYDSIAAFSKGAL